jgi:hypothetical protein
MFLWQPILLCGWGAGGFLSSLGALTQMLGTKSIPILQAHGASGEKREAVEGGGDW